MDPRRISCQKLFLCFCIWIFLLSGCERKSSDPQSPPASPPPAALESILNTGSITLITRNNANCYYQYRDRYMGFEYELAREFADYLGVELKVRIAEKWEDMLKILAGEPGAFIAEGMHPAPGSSKDTAFSEPYMMVRHHLIVRWDKEDIQHPADLSGRHVYIPARKTCLRVVKDFQESGIDLHIRQEECDEEELIRRVADGETEVAIVDSHIAFLHRKYYPRAVVREGFGKEFPLVWAVRPEAGKLLDRMNAFLQNVRKNGRFAEIYEQYYGEVPPLAFDETEHFLKTLSERLPLYHPVIRKSADTNGFDWRLIAAQIYQESHFNPKARSSAGAWGLMQIIRSTGRSLNITELTDPHQNIEAGVRYLKNLYDFFDKAEGEDRLRIALSAYNVGQGHVQDARNIARAGELDPDQWDSLARTLPLLQHEKYHRDSLYGYCRGTEPVEYVQKIMSYYEILKRRYAPEQAEQKPGF